ncbi:MAG: 3-dehydroquinate synthase [Salibacteraceae bacterium]
MIKIDSTYSIVVAESVVDVLSTFIKEHYGNHKIIFLVDENSEEHCLPIFNWSDNDALLTAEVLTVPAGEESKCLTILERLAETLIELHAQKNTIIINLGGGMITDLGGFLASSYKRGIPFVNVPTSLLAMVDASVGGKTAVNIGNYKNQLGSFYNPVAVFCGLEFLSTLPLRELKSGYAEMIKHILIVNQGKSINLKTLNVNELPTEELIGSSITIKNDIVIDDPKENGNRRKLNFGHTIGHAFESLSHSQNKPLLHGEAVAIGILIESWISNEFGNLTDKDFEQISSVIRSTYDLYFIQESDYLNLLDLMQADKKNENLAINFTLLDTINESSIDHFMSEDQIEKALIWYTSIL